jgi:hypothetical protein
MDRLQQSIEQQVQLLQWMQRYVTERSSWRDDASRQQQQQQYLSDGLAQQHQIYTGMHWR